MTRLAHFLTAFLFAAVVPVGSAVAGAPKFLEVGKTYSLSSIAGTQTVKVLEIDKESGWVKTQVDKPRSEIIWLNTSQLVTIREGAAPPSAADKPMPPINFGK
jgi:hypothetical protein